MDPETGEPVRLDNGNPEVHAMSVDAILSIEDGQSVRPGDVLRPFAAPERPWGRGHRGVDLAVSPGAAVLAPAAGTVVFAGTVVDRPVVTLEHADGTRSSLEPVEADVAVVAVVVLAGVSHGAVARGDGARTEREAWPLMSEDDVGDGLGAVFHLLECVGGAGVGGEVVGVVA